MTLQKFRIPLPLILLAIALRVPLAAGEQISILVHNVENFFDLDGVTMFEEYSQESADGFFPYHPGRLLTKVNNHAALIHAFDEGRGPDIVALQELEVDFTPDPSFDLEDALQAYQNISVAALLIEELDDTIAGFPAEFFLLKRLKELGLGDYRFYGPEFDPTWFERGIAHRNAFLSRIPVVSHRQHRLEGARDILEATFEINGHPFTVYNNHWKSGASSPRSEPDRVQQAAILRSLIDQKLAANPAADLILVGDFNSQHNQALRLGLTHGIPTAIDGVLGSQSSEQAVARREQTLYNLWYELPREERGSEVWAGNWSTLMQILITPGLYDQTGLQYYDQSFGVFRVPGLNACSETGNPLSWVNLGQGSGVSDHLPVYARFRWQANGQLHEKKLYALGDYRDTNPTPVPARQPSIVRRSIDRDPKKLALMGEDELAAHIGIWFLVRGTYDNGGILIGKSRYDLYGVTEQVRAHLRSLKQGSKLRFAGEFSIFRGQLQFVIHDLSWINPKL